MTVLMRALNLSSSFITWTSNTPDYEGVNAPESIQSGSAIVVADTGGTDTGGTAPIQKLGLDYSPVGLWLFENNLTDSSGNGFNLTGSPSYTTVEKDKQVGAIFDTTAWTRPSRDNSLAIIGAVTIEFILRINIAGAEMTLCTFGSTGLSEAENVAYMAIIGVGGTMSLSWESGASITRQVTSTANLIPYGIPCHLVFTRSATSPAVVNFYVNGENKFSGSDVAATGCTSVNCRFRIGSDNNGTRLVDRGSVFSSFKIIAAELTPAQVVAEYNRTLGGHGIVYQRL